MFERANNLYVLPFFNFRLINLIVHGEYGSSIIVSNKYIA